MAARTPTAQRRNQFHRDWGNYAGLINMPNAASNALSDPLYSFLEAGDHAYDTAGNFALCTNPGTPGGGDATWIIVNGSAASGVRDSHRVVVGLVASGDVAGVSCDYADAGDGVALAAAFAALTPGQDIRLRTGTYTTFSTLALPAGSRLLGMGPENTVLIGNVGDGGGPTLTLDVGASAVDIGVQASGVHLEIITMAPQSYIDNVATQSAGGASGGAHIRSLVADGIRILNYRATNTVPNTNRPNAITIGDASAAVYGGSDIRIQNVTATGFGFAINAASIYDFTFENITHDEAWTGGVRVRWREVNADSENTPYLIRDIRCSLRAPLLDLFFFDAVNLETDVPLGAGVVKDVWMTALGEIDAVAWLTGVHLRSNGETTRGTKISNVNVVSIEEVGHVRGVELRTFLGLTPGVMRDTVVDAVTVGPGTFSDAAVLENIGAGSAVERTKISNCAGRISLNDAAVTETIVVMNTGGLVDAGTGTVQANNIP